MSATRVLILTLSLAAMGIPIAQAGTTKYPKPTEKDVKIGETVVTVHVQTYTSDVSKGVSITVKPKDSDLGLNLSRWSYEHQPTQYSAGLSISFK